MSVTTLPSFTGCDQATQFQTRIEAIRALLPVFGFTFHSSYRTDGNEHFINRSTHAMVSFSFVSNHTWLFTAPGETKLRKISGHTVDELRNLLFVESLPKDGNARCCACGSLNVEGPCCNDESDFASALAAEPELTIGEYFRRIERAETPVPAPVVVVAETIPAAPIKPAVRVVLLPLGFEMLARVAKARTMAALLAGGGISAAEAERMTPDLWGKFHAGLKERGVVGQHSTPPSPATIERTIVALRALAPRRVTMPGYATIAPGIAVRTRRRRVA